MYRNKSMKNGIPLVMTGVMPNVAGGILKEMASVPNRDEAKQLFQGIS